MTSIGFVLRKPLKSEPGNVHNYTNGVPTVTGAIINNAVGVEVGEFAERHLFHPSGIADYTWTEFIPMVRSRPTVGWPCGRVIWQRLVSSFWTTVCGTAGESFLNNGFVNPQRHG